MNSQYQVTEVRDGQEPTIFVINGFLSESHKDVDDWLSVVDEIYPLQRVLHLHWPSFSFKKLFKFDSESTLKSAISLAISMVSAKAVLSKTLLDAVAGWKDAIHKAEEAGSWLAKYIDSQDSRTFVLMGHSLGARVSCHALKNLKRADSVHSMYLFGGAVSNKETWDGACANHPKLKVINCFSENDYVLKFLYKVGTLFTNTPVGLKYIPKEPETLIYNVDLSHIVNGHTTYKNKKVGTCLKERVKLAPKGYLFLDSSILLKAARISRFLPF